MFYLTLVLSYVLLLCAAMWHIYSTINDSVCSQPFEKDLLKCSANIFYNDKYMTDQFKFFVILLNFYLYEIILVASSTKAPVVFLIK